MGHGVRVHEKRFKQEYVNSINSKQQDKYIAKVKANEDHRPQEHE